MDLKEVTGVTVARHPWEVTRFEFFDNLLQDAKLLERPEHVLDVGSGDAWFAQQLLPRMQPTSQIDCWDLQYNEESRATLGITEDGIRLVSEQPSDRYSLIMLLDVLEHVENDRDFLRKIIDTNLAPGGVVLISVPAWQQLYSEHDRWLLHHRRYSPSELRSLLLNADLDAGLTGGLFHSLLVPRTIGLAQAYLAKSAASYLAKGATRSDPKPLAWTAGPFVTQVVTRALQLDNRLSLAAAKASISIPGLSLWALCKQP